MRFALAILLAACFSAAATDYHLSPSGDDAHPGTAAQPWRTLERAAAQQLRPGDQLLFAAGATFSGTLRLEAKHSGAPNRPVVVGSYGAGRATLSGGNSSAIVISGCRWLTLRNLRLTGSGRASGNTTSGLVVDTGGDLALDQLEVSGFQHSGIEIRGVERIRLTRIHAHQNGAAGISSREPVSRDVYIGHSLAENNPGDPTVRKNHSGNGIVLGYVKGGLIEYSEARYNGWDMPWTGNGPVGIWAYQSDRVVIQFCVSHHNRSTAEDGGGFDFDGGMTNSVLQYNYSHDNFGAGYLICQYDGAGEFSNNVVRYNISQDDGLLAHNSGIFVWVGGSGMKSTLVHNNTIFNTKGSAVAIDFPARFKDQLPRIDFFNNIFVSRQSQIRGAHAPAWRFAGNLYWSMGERGFEAQNYKDFEQWSRATGQETFKGRLAGRFADPGLLKDGPGLITSPDDLAKLHEYGLGPHSPAIGAGLDLRGEFGIDPGPRDFFGVRPGLDAGAAQRPGPR